MAGLALLRFQGQDCQGAVMKYQDEKLQALQFDPSGFVPVELLARPSRKIQEVELLEILRNEMGVILTERK